MTDEYPTGAFWLLLIGGILELLIMIPYAIIAGVIGAKTITGAMDVVPMAGAVLAVCAVWFLIWGILMILAAVWVKSGNPDKVHKGAVLGLIASILVLPNFLSFILGLIGAILAFGWSKKAPVAVPPPPPPPA